jgi:hypothetical protein
MVSRCGLARQRNPFVSVVPSLVCKALVTFGVVFTTPDDPVEEIAIFFTIRAARWPGILTKENP